MLFILFLIALFGYGHALNCTSCQSEISWDDCREVATVEICTTDEVNEFHAVEILANPTLTQGGSEDDFQCYALYLRSKDTGVTSPDRFSTGCTFRKTQFCEGWINALEVVECGTSETGDVSFGGVGRLGGGLVMMILVGLCFTVI